MRILRWTAFVLAAALAGCASGGGTTPAAPGAAAAARGSGTMSIQVSVPVAVTTSSTRRTAAITAATNGVLMQSFAHTDTGHVTPTASGAFDISTASSLCVAGPPRLCTISLSVPAGTVDIVATTYDAAPVADAFTTAHMLGQGTIFGVTIVQNSTNALNLVVGGTVASVTVTPALQTLAPSTPANYTLAFTARDAQSQVIVAGANTVTNGSSNTETDTFSNPIVFHVTESGGTGHTLLSLDGGAHAASVTATKSSDAIAVFYDGGASAGYTASISATATGASVATVSMNLNTATSIYVANRDTGSVLAFPLGGPYGNVAPSKSVGGSNSPLSDPVGLTVDPAGNIYTVDDSGQTVIAFTAAQSGNVTASRTFTPTSGAQSEGLAVDGSGKIYESSYISGSVLVMPPNASGSVAPAFNIAGAATTLVTPIGMAIDGAGNLYVADRSTQTIDIFAPGANGNVAPTAIIGGGSTMLSTPVAVAIDGTGRIIVANESAAITIYANGASGNVAPVAAISGSNTLLLSPSGVGIDPSGGFWISDALANQLLKFATNANGNVAPIASISGGATGLGDPQQLTIR